MTEKATRELWVDDVKVIACAFVVLGHFFQSMTKANILNDGGFLTWFNTAIYTFHVPLFFICSGYLYNKYSHIQSFSDYGKNVSKKALDLGIPYFTFSLITWALKTVFADSVNDKAGGLLNTLFLNPISPYWFLYCLFIMFLITPTFSKKSYVTVLLCISFALKTASIFYGNFEIGIISQFMKNYLWFVAGMLIALMNTRTYFKNKRVLPVSIATLIVFLISSIAICVFELDNGFIKLIIGIFACFGIISLTGYVTANGKQSPLFAFMGKYTMPIFLMHTIFCAPIRSILIKLSIFNPAIHVILGIAVSFAGPILAAVIMHKLKYPEFFIYPRKTLKNIKESNN